ncbi:uncharacterized protein LOC131689142 [Topomyia yanbarensis]|uniref:uncharacterized protein LOC131689142 n=1 Tax=Topomyia yanbarensis TaxID=2498891 RepID=UPI00273CE276|nr:uncharacterized protein LOC131689142 [Topomyia yanbarensis]
MESSYKLTTREIFYAEPPYTLTLPECGGEDAVSWRFRVALVAIRDLVRRGFFEWRSVSTDKEMAQIKTFRIVGHIYAAFMIVIAMSLAIRSLGSFGSEEENSTVLALKSIFSLYCFAFAVMLVIGIEMEKIEYVIVYRIFVISRSICGLIYMVINSLIIIVDHANAASTGKMIFGIFLLILAMVIFFAIVAIELLLVEGIKRYTEQTIEVIKLPSVTPV